jgi:DNA topoisomerase-1
MIETLESVLELTQVLPKTITDTESKTSTVGLVYIFDNQPGFTRYRSGNKFYYLDGATVVTDKAQLARIKSLVLPPAWKNVWICKLENGHLQATGYDQINRKQYRYHPLWIAIRNQSKFYRLSDFGKRLPMIRAHLERDLSLPGLPERKVLAIMVSLLEGINSRVGFTFYEKLYRSFELTTPKNRAVKIDGIKLRLTFCGKKGVSRKISLSSKRLAHIIRGCKEIPGKALFEYYDEEGFIHPVDSGELNNYIAEISGGDFTAKDFRTWAGSVNALLGFKEVGGFENFTEMKRKISVTINIVAKQLGNTKAVCKKYYIHPVIILLFQQRKLEDYIRDLNGEVKSKVDGYVDEEKVLLRILENEHVKNKHMIG